MPAFIKTPRDERLWKRAQTIVRDEYDVRVGSDQYWALVNGIFHRMSGRVKQNPGAQQHYRTFHGVEPNRVDEKRSWVPGEMTFLGYGVDVGYGIKDRRSSKEGWYVHDFGRGVMVYKRAGVRDRVDRVFKRFPSELMVLGRSLGFTYQNEGQRKEVKGGKSQVLAATPSRTTVVVVGPKGVEYLFTGGAMRVEDWIYN